MNGSSGASLRDDYLEARNAVEDAIGSMQKYAHPNGRDYYPQSTEAFESARSEHFDRMKRLQSVSQELLELAEHCDQYAKQ